MYVGGRRGLEERIGGRKGRISRKGKERRKEEKLVSEPERGSHYWVELTMAIHVPSSPTFPQVVSLMSHKYVYKDVYVTAAEVVRMVLAYLKEDKCVGAAFCSSSSLHLLPVLSSSVFPYSVLTLHNYTYSLPSFSVLHPFPPFTPFLHLSPLSPPHSLPSLHPLLTSF